MHSRDLSKLMWGEALSLLEQADRLHRQFCRPASVHAPVWEPPIDVVESADTLSVHVALPGVPADSVLVELETDAVTVSARRPFPLESSPLASSPAQRVHALEIPYGRFQRRIGLRQQGFTAGSLALIGRVLQDGCLTLTFSKNKKEST